MQRLPLAALTLLGIAGWSTTRAAPALAADKPRVWAIAIGVNKYEDGLIPACTGSIRDARSVASWVAETAGWGEPAVLRIDDFGKEPPADPAAKCPELKPTRKNLDWAIDRWLGRRVGPDDIVLIYYAGQAVARPPGPGAATGKAYLLPIDARALDVEGTGWSLDAALDRSGLARKARVVVWLDTSLRGRGQGRPPDEPGCPSGFDWLRSLTRWENATAWLAADGRINPEDGAFVAAVRRGMGTPEDAHNLMGCLKSLQDDPALAARGFRSVGGFGPGVSLWSGGVKVVEQAVPELIVQAGHGDRVTSVVVAADDASVITASMDSTVRVWKLGDREPAMVRILTDPFLGVKALALDPDGRLLLAGDGAGRVVGWDMAEDRPRPIYGPPGHDEGIVEIRFLPEGPRFVSLDRLGKSALWDGSAGAIRKLGALADEPIARLASATRPEAGAPAMVASIEATPGGPDTLRAFDARGRAILTSPGPGGRISALDLSADGRRLVVGNEDGRVMVLEFPGRAVAFDRTYSGPIRAARFSKSGAVAISDDRSFRLVEPRAGGADSELLDARGVAVPGRVDRVEFSGDGRWLAACTATGGKPLAWGVADPKRPIALAIPDDGPSGLSPAFSPDGRLLLMGDVDGGLRAWTLEDGPTGPKAEARTRVRPSRGKVAALCPSSTGRFLLEITKDDLGLVWDLEQGRGCKPLTGRWTSGAFLPDDSKLVLSRRGDQGGDVVVFDRSKDAPIATVFRRPVDADGRPTVASFERVVVSKSGRWAAAASNPGQLPLACVWDVATGDLVHSARIHDGGLSAIDFSADEQYLLTASADGTAKLWPLADRSVELRRAEVTFFNTDEEAPAFSAARVCPDDRRRVATGSRGGLVTFWAWEKGKGRPTRLGDPSRLNGEVNALAFSPDGKWLAASATIDKAIRFWDVSGEGRPKPVEFRPRLAHHEQVGALVGWPGGSLIVSGGDDAAVRFWDLKDRSLIGTLIAQARDARLVDWLAFTPGGLFDGSLPGESMVKWRVGPKVVTLEQSQDTHHVFQLAGAFGRGEKPKAPDLQAEAPALRIFDPPADRKVEAREVELTLWTGDPSPNGLRLYQNGVPVRAEGDFQPGDTPHFARTRVQLRTGENRLYAMASKPGTADGKSAEIVLRYDGPEPAGRLHTLALGISGYEKRALKYAHADARGIADFLRRQGVQGAGEPGERIVLVDEEVDLDRIEDAFRKLRDATKGRPEDTVVLFLAGHTDTDEAANQFCLLLPKFPFEGDLPAIADVATRGVATRGNAGAGGVRARVGDPNVLPYVVLYNRLARLEALRRLVIVDACQAGAILDDRAVGNIQKYVERGSRKARNSYLLAARRGEPANEVDALQHGLLTYTLLRGMGADGLKPVPEALGGFPGPPSADRDRDGFVSSDELVAFADDALPRLAAMFPLIVLRAGGPLPNPAPPRGDLPPDLEKALRVQSAEASFPLVIVPRRP